MRNKSPSLIGAIMLGSCLAAGPALAAGDIAKGKAIATQGDPAGLPPCSGCHGAAGQGQPSGGIPRLAGLPAAYLAHELESFGNGTRDNAVMTSFAKMMDQGTMADLAAYYASLPTPAADSKQNSDAKTVALGEALALHGDWAKTIPACASCHGVHGLGVGAAFPPLVGQPAAYIKAQLEDWRDGKRSNAPLGLMRGVASRLDPAQIAAVAAYYESLPTEARR